MTLIGTLRDKMTKWVVGIVALSILAFILNDLLGSNSFFGGNNNVVGEIDGNVITLEAYQLAVKEMENMYVLNSGRALSEGEKTFIRTQVWDKFIERYVVIPQYEKLGIEITEEELWDLIQGDYIDESVERSFLDSLGNFSRSKLLDYLQQLDGQPQGSASRRRWSSFVKDLTSTRLKTKYENLIIKTNYVTRSLMEQAYHLQKDTMTIDFVYVPVYAVPDSLVTISEEEMQHYYDENKKKYKQEKSRDIRYVQFPIIPSERDSVAIRQQLTQLVVDFSDTEEDSLFASINSDQLGVVSSHTLATLPLVLTEKQASLEVGDVLGPWLDGNVYKLVKVMSVDEGDQDKGSARANHILIKWNNGQETSKREAKNKAQKILNNLKKGADFSAKAKEFGSDGTASQGGDLGWFDKGKMVKPFEEAVFQAQKTGLIPHLIETQFGYHIIEVTHLKDNSFYTLATIARKILAGDDTQNKIYRKADVFRSRLNGLEDFNARAEADSVAIKDATDLKPDAVRINNLEGARQVVLWSFKDTSSDEISDVFSVGDNYLVAVVTKEVGEGYQPIEQIKEEIKSTVGQDKKAVYIIEKMKGLTGSLSEIATTYGSQAKFYADKMLAMNNNSFPSVGLDPIAIGKTFLLNKGARSSPFQGQRGVMIVEVKDKMIAPEIADYAKYGESLLAKKNGSSRTAIYQVLKKSAEIEDRRYLFY